MTEPAPDLDPRRLYEDTLVRAMRYAQRHLPREQALEVAHEVASEIVRRPSGPVTGSLIYLTVKSRLRNLWRASRRRAAAEGAYFQMRARSTPGWTVPDGELEIDELQQRIQTTLAAMPAGMRDVFLVIRDDECSYKEAAAQLGVSVGTVHTQLSRASALLRECVKRYLADEPSAPQVRIGQ